MARPSKANLRRIGEIASMYRWNVAFGQTPSAITVPPNFNLQCSSVALPKKDAGQSVEIKIRGHSIKRPGIYDDSHQITMNFIETVDNQVSTFLKSWRDALWDPDTGVQMPLSAVQGDVIITRLDNQDNEIWTYDLKGCYLEDYDPTGGELGADASEVLRPTITLYYDTFEDGPN